jgi:signal transduction histidine kinase
VALDDLPDATVVIGADRTIVGVNNALAGLVGWAPEALRGRPCAEALGVRDESGQLQWPDRWPDGSQLRSVRAIDAQPVTLRHADGGDVSAVATGRYLRDATGSVTGAVVAFRPGPRARADSEPSAIEVVSTVSHELRSPLTSVKGYTSLLLNRWERLGDDQKMMMLEQVNHDADRVVRLITELLDISRLEAGRLVLRRQLVDLGDLAGNVVAKVRMEYPDLDADLRFDPPPPKVWADPDKIEQVLTNLVENACKYASPQGLIVEWALDAGEINVVVTDRGKGIPSEDLPRVFTKFFRRAEGKPTGSGLGLWISQGLVEAHGGQLIADSPPGQGASFRFTLPIVDVEKLQEP